MARILCTVSLALAAVSAVSGHVIRRNKAPPTGWDTPVLQNYDVYHQRYDQWGCKDQHNTTFFDTCCHPLLKGESVSVLENLGCSDACEDDNSSVLPSSTSSSSPQPAVASSSASASSSSKPASAALAKGDNSPAPVPSSSPKPSTSTSAAPSSSTPAPAQTTGSGSSNSNGGDVHTGGEGTFFYQNGVAGACGTVHSDSELICAIDSQLYSKSICGKSVRITNTQNGKSVTVVVADECPTCTGPNSVDMSTGAYNQIGDPSQGVLPIAWEFV